MSYYWYRVYLVGPCVPVKQEFIQEIEAKGTSGQDKLSEKNCLWVCKVSR